MLAPFGIVEYLIKRDFLPHGRNASLVLARPEKFDGKPSRFRKEAEQEVMPSCFRFGSPAEKQPETVPPVFPLNGRRCRIAVGDVQRIDEMERCGRSMAARSVERFHTVADGIHFLLSKVDRQDGVVCLEVFSLNGTFDCPCVVFKPQGEFTEVSFGIYGPAIICDIFRHNIFDEGLREPVRDDLFPSVHSHLNFPCGCKGNGNRCSLFQNHVIFPATIKDITPVFKRSELC